METQTISPATANANPENPDADDEDDDAPQSRKYSRLPLYVESADVLDRSALVNPEESDPAKFLLKELPANFDAETHRIRRKDFQDETHFLEMRANSKEKIARDLLMEVETARAQIAQLRKLPLDQRTAVVEYQKAQSKMAKLRAQIEAMGIEV